jgi:hypothetical protein
VKVSFVLHYVLKALMAGLMAFPLILTDSHPTSSQANADKPPEAIQGGVWTDDFLTDQWMSKQDNTQVDSGHLGLKLLEPLHWTQTWTAHFAGGEFYQTEAISDSVRLAPDGAGQYFTDGAYISGVLNAGKKVDWASAKWTFAGIPGSLIIEFRTGSSPNPDAAWTGWKSPENRINESYCVYIVNSYQVECLTNMVGIASSPYIQYRATFSSDDPTETVALNDIDLLYGLHPASGTAGTALITSVDLREWQTLVISSTVTLSTTLAVDILAADGIVLLQDVQNGDSLASLDPQAYPALQLRANLTTQDSSLSPDLDLWGLRWSVISKLYLPVILRGMK